MVSQCRSLVKLEKKLAQRLRKLRNEKGLTQEAFADLAGIGPKYYQKLEGKNPSSATLQMLQKIAKAHGITIQELIDPEDGSC